MTLVRIPMQLMTVNVQNANAFYTVVDGTNFDYDCVRYADGVVGTAWFKCVIPANLTDGLQSTWTTVLYHKKPSGAGGDVRIGIDAKAMTHAAAFDTALTGISTLLSAVQTSANMTITGLDSFGAETLIGGGLLVVKVLRDGTDIFDTINSPWDLLQVALQCEVF